MFNDGTAMRVLPEALVELAFKLFPSNPNAISLVIDGLTLHDQRMLATIAMRDGPEAAEQYFRSRRRGIRRIGRVSLR
jgi:hypothetical protein